MSGHFNLRDLSNVAFSYIQDFGLDIISTFAVFHGFLSNLSLNDRRLYEEGAFNKFVYRTKFSIQSQKFGLVSKSRCGFGLSNKK